MTTRLFRRVLQLDVSLNDPTDSFSLDMRISTDPIPRRITFKATKTWKREPNTCEVQIYNLSPEQRANLSKAKTPTIKLAAGYSGNTSLSQIFYGSAIYCKHEYTKEGDIVTTLSTTDGGEKKQQARVNISFGPGTTTGTVLRRIVKELGLKQGNADSIAKEIDKGVKATIYSAGVTISGSAANELGHLCRACGYDYSIQDGAVQILKLGQARDDFAIVLDETSGLIGSPSISNKGVVSGQCLIFSAGAGLDLSPGRLIKLESQFLSGQFILGKCDFSGDNFADDWYCNFEAVAKKGQLVEIK